MEKTPAACLIEIQEICCKENKAAELSLSLQTEKDLRAKRAALHVLHLALKERIKASQRNVISASFILIFFACRPLALFVMPSFLPHTNVCTKILLKNNKRLHIIPTSSAAISKLFKEFCYNRVNDTF